MTCTKLLLLAGGKSTRMGFSKHLLPLPSGLPLYTRIAAVLCKAYPGSAVYISLNHDSATDHDLIESTPNDRHRIVRSETGLEIPLEVIYDDDYGGAPHGDAPDIGPAAGLLAAHRSDPNAVWAIAACDYPLLTVQALSQLRQAYSPPVTCFQNAEGHVEPLLAIWSPEALATLTKNVDNGKLGPTTTVKEINGNVVRPAGGEEADMWLWNTNTEDEWTNCRAILDEWHGDGYH